MKKGNRNRSKQTAVCSLALMMTGVLVLSACNADSAASTQKTPEQKNDPAALVKIDIVAYPQAGFAPVNGTETQKFLEQKFNVKFNVLPVDSGSPEKFNLFWAQGGKADVIMARTELNDMIDQGLIKELNTDELYKRMPTWMKKIDSLVGNPELTKRLITYNGKLYSIPFTHGPVMESGVMIARKDWMKNVGIEKAPTNLDEFEQLLKAFTLNDPDKNGKNDTYGIHGGQRYHFNYVWGAYGLMPKTFTLQNGKITYTSILPKYKEALKLISKWYKAGYIDPEFVTDDRTKQRDKWSQGKFGVLADNAFWADSVRGESGVLAMVEAKNKTADFMFLPPFKGPDGLVGSFVDFPSLRADGAVYFGKDASAQVVNKMMEIKEALASDWELYKRVYYGVEGTDYTVESGGKMTVSPKLNAEIITKEGIAQTWGLMPITIDWMSKTMTERDKVVHSMSMEQPKTFNGKDFPVSSTNKALKNKGEDVFKLVDEFYVNAITGKVDIDAAWDKYVDSVNKAGLTDILAEYQTLYDQKK
ncbi:DUF3502 domain-containing protein [Paenibacillus thalictri]|uniref:Extracellular solute-binding protein n=1 Tax=Paenibacillus thalictri TaxID=2527873 RepID=A0A4Q9DUG0_9BACL|nr:DUF3502 domain-containing protein [Paenibacillus thalictri]TBL79048.1 hypothetical protein EYB31_12545 [Paenibacillus thalictri]